MINYSTCMRGNPTDKDAAKKAYANAQYSQVMTLDKFCYHIASHGCVYSRADIQAILILAVDCLREQLLNGQAGKTTVDLTGNSSAAGIAADDADASRIPAASGEPADENS